MPAHDAARKADFQDPSHECTMAGKVIMLVAWNTSLWGPLAMLMCLTVTPRAHFRVSVLSLCGPSTFPTGRPLHGHTASVLTSNLHSHRKCCTPDLTFLGCTWQSKHVHSLSAAGSISMPVWPWATVLAECHRLQGGPRRQQTAHGGHRSSS